jgi:hypothetical protein
MLHDSQMERVVRRRLITEDTGVYCKAIKQLVYVTVCRERVVGRQYSSV